jgi:hypothetical protein
MPSEFVRSRWSLALASCLLAALASAQSSPPLQPCPQSSSGLYARIRSVALDSHQVYFVRDASIDHASLHIDLDDGTIAFTEDICGRITGAFFEGEGEIRLRPPNRAERGSMQLFTGMAILEEQFTSGYLRFNDDTAADLLPTLKPAPEPAEFTKKWDDTSRNLADFDALRLFLDFSHFLPEPRGHEPAQKFPSYLHAHLLGRKLGAFEVFWDASVAEPLWVGQARNKDDTLYFDIWTSFAPRTADSPDVSLSNDVAITSFRIQAWVQPPTRLRASTEAKIRIVKGGERTLLFELSRFLKVDSVEADGKPVDFIQNPAIEGTQLRRKGNDVLALVFPAPLRPVDELKLRFTYAGEVLSEAGNGLLYVGERGTWYPNFGLSPAQFDMEFHYPSIWTLLATGKLTTGKQPLRRTSDSPETNPGAATAAPSALPSETVSHWTSERPIPVAGFNLGKYVRADARAGNILVQAFGTKGVEKSFPKPSAKDIEPFPTPSRSRPIEPADLPPPAPSPAHDTQAVADRAARAIENFSQWFGPYPYSSLALTQMPGDLSQGWPSLVFLSSFAFLSPQEQADLHLAPLTRERNDLVLVHETAHQWWGDLVLWRSYRDQWISEALANYSALLILEQKNPEQFHQILESYRHDLLSQNKDGEWLRDAGPVTLGLRLDSSHFPDGYEGISYERGTWLFHMLRSMLRDATLRDAYNPTHDAETESRSRKARSGAPLNPDEPFFRALRKIRDLYAGKSISTEQMIRVFEDALPRPLWYEHRPKLDWFLDGWIEGTAIPELQTREVRIAQKAGVTTVTGVIVQKGAPNDLVTPIPVYAATTGNSLVFLGQVLADGQETTFHLIAPDGTRKVVLDPNQTLLTSPK